MTSSRWCIAVSSVAMLALIAALSGQQPQQAPHAGYVYPAGGQRGTTFQVKVGGRFLNGTAAVVVSGRGVEAKVLDYDRPLNGQQLTELREKLQALQKQGNRAELQKELTEARMKIGDSQRRNQNPTLAEIVTLEVTIAADADPGGRQLRLQTPFGLTNPLVFQVGDLPEFRERDIKNSAADTELQITLPAIVNGRMIPGDVDRVRVPLRQLQQYQPGDVDRYRFHARKGAQLVVAASARELIPYLADAVPGWFQAVLTLYDAAGRELAYDDDYQFNPDPVLHYAVQADGDYVVEIRDALYRGREDFVYRIAIGEVPFITSIFPLGGPAGERTSVEVAGWNLPARKITLDAKRWQPGIYPISLPGPTKSSPGLIFSRPFAVDTLPETLEREPNDAPGAAQRVKVPVIVNGRIQTPGDSDTFSFAGRAGEDIVAEVSARRLDSPLDSVLELTDAAGHRLAFNDDHEDKGAGLVTHQADSLLTARLPAAGTYYVRLADAQHKGGAEYAYRLRISESRPDFDLRVAPSEINASGSASVPVTVCAIRKDGFAGDIALSLKDAPGGFSLSGAVVPAGQSEVRITLGAPPAPTSHPVTVRIEGRATIQGRTVVRVATPAEQMMQAFAYEHLVPADSLHVSVSGRGATRVPASVASPQPVKIPAGSSANVRVALPPAWLTLQNLKFELSDPPEGMVLRDAAVAGTGGQLVLQADASKIKPGARGNLIVTVSGERTGRGQQQAPAARQRVPIGALPAIAYEIVK